MMLRRTLVIVTTLVALVVGMANPAAAGTRGVNNYVEADNASPRRQMVRDNVAVVTDADGDVNAENIAAARSHDCTGCRTLAVAVEVVLVPVTPTRSAPVNIAYALNERCSSCATYAGAWQYAVQTGGVRRLGGKAMDKIENLAEQIEEVARSGQDFPTIDAQLDSLTSQIWDTVNQDVVRQGGTPNGTPEKN
jgi:hypothetical protein